jgi:hypothetical protein
MSNVSNWPSFLLQRIAGRAERDPHFLGSALAAYRQVEGLDEAGLARRLGCSVADLPRLALCRRPVTVDDSFDDDVRQIAAWAGAAEDELVNVLVYAESVETLRRVGPRARSGGALLAARDVVAEQSEEPADRPDAQHQEDTAHGTGAERPHAVQGEESPDA